MDSASSESTIASRQVFHRPRAYSTINRKPKNCSRDLLILHSRQRIRSLALTSFDLGC